MIEVEDSVVINERKLLMSKKSENAGEINARVRYCSDKLKAIAQQLSDAQARLQGALTLASQSFVGVESINTEDFENPINNANKAVEKALKAAGEATSALDSFTL